MNAEKLNFSIAVVGEKSAQELCERLKERVANVQFFPADETPSLVRIFLDDEERLRSASADRRERDEKLKNLKKILEKHALWLDGKPGGERADLSGWDLSGNNLSLRRLNGANLRGTNFTGAQMRGTKLAQAEMAGAIFTRANLREADFKDAVTDNAVFWDATLTDAKNVPDWVLEQASQKPPESDASRLQDTPETPPPLSYIVICMEGDSFHWNDTHFFQTLRFGTVILFGGGKQFDRLKKKGRFQIAEELRDILNILVPGGGREQNTSQQNAPHQNASHQNASQKEPTRKEAELPLPSPAAPAPGASPPRADSIPVPSQVWQGRYTYLNEQEIVPLLTAGTFPKCRNPIRIDVSGMGSNIGCTTQAVAIWHYCKAIGLEPAILGEKSDQVLLGGTDAADGFRVAGVRFVTHENGGFNCYINDASGNRDMSPNADILVMVAGLKPWEWDATKEWMANGDKVILRHNPGLRIVILLSYATVETYQSVEPFFRRYPHAAVTYQHSDAWNPPVEALVTIDGLLREQIQAVCSKKQEEKNDV